LEERGPGGASDPLEREIDGGAGRIEQLRGLLGGLAGLAFGPERAALILTQHLPPRAGEQPVEDAGDMAYVEADRGRTAGASPDLGRRESGNDALQVLAGLDQRVRDRHQVRVDPVDRSSQPCFRCVAHLALSSAGPMSCATSAWWSVPHTISSDRLRGRGEPTSVPTTSPPAHRPLWWESPAPRSTERAPGQYPGTR